MVTRTYTQQIADDLREQIADGRLPVGSSIPSHAQLTQQYGYSTSVTRKAVDQLRAEGLLVGQPGKAVYVQATPADVEQESTHAGALAARLAALEENVRGLAEGTGAPIDTSAIAELRQETDHLRKQVAVLRSHLMDLYGRLGQPYPHGLEAEPVATRPRDADTGS